MGTARRIDRVFKGKPTLEGAGVHLKRVFGYHDVPRFDPFLLLDDFHSNNPAHYLAGFPWHPHRGIETITYVTAGEVDHGDSLGNRGTIGPGDVQWMTAGSGIIHQEMPHGNERGQMHGFQLWANLPSSLKMTAPKYRDVTAADIPEVIDDDGTALKIISGSFWGRQGPVRDVAAEPQYLDVFVPPGRRRSLPVPTTRHAFAYVFQGGGRFANASEPQAVTTDVVGGEDAGSRYAENRSLVVFDSGDEVTVRAGEQGIRFLLVSGAPLGEPIAWRGPIVMNTQEELRQAFEEFRSGTFLKHER